MASSVDASDETDLPRLSGPIPMPLPVSPLAAYADSEVMREEALQPTAAHSLLRRPDPAALMAIPYNTQTAPSDSPLPAAGAERAGEEPASRSAEPAQAGVPAPGALAKPLPARSEEVAFSMQEGQSDLPVGEAAAIGPETYRAILPDVALPQPKKRRARLEDIDNDGASSAAVSVASTSGAPALTLPPVVSPRRAPEDWETGATVEIRGDTPTTWERVRNYGTREASPERAPMALARTGPASAQGSRAQAVTFGNAPSQAQGRMSGAGEIIHRQVVQRAETGESVAGGGEGGADQGQAGGHNAEQEQAKQGDEGAASGDINLLANEVYGLIKRRLAQEAERMGRSR